MRGDDEKIYLMQYRPRKLEVAFTDIQKYSIVHNPLATLISTADNRE